MKMKNKFEKEKIDPNVLTFLELLLEKAGMSDLPEDILANMLADLYVRFINFTMTNIVSSLTKEQVIEFEEFLSKNPDEYDVEYYLKNNLSNFPELIQNNMKEFEKTYLEKM